MYWSNLPQIVVDCPFLGVFDSGWGFFQKLYDLLGGLACWRNGVLVVFWLQQLGALLLFPHHFYVLLALTLVCYRGTVGNIPQRPQNQSGLVISIKGIGISLLVLLVNLVLQPLSMARWFWQESCALCPCYSSAGWAGTGLHPCENHI